MYYREKNSWFNFNCIAVQCSVHAFEVDSPLIHWHTRIYQAYVWCEFVVIYAIIVRPAVAAVRFLFHFQQEKCTPDKKKSIMWIRGFVNNNECDNDKDAMNL